MTLTLPVQPKYNDSSWSFKVRRTEAKYGVGGYVQLRRNGINRISATWDLSCVTQEYTVVQDFLRNRKGIEPFYVAYGPDSTVDETRLFTCDEWTFTPIGSQAWRLNATLTQVFRLL